MKENHHLCYTCNNAKPTTSELADTIYVSYECKYKDVEYHAITVRLPSTNHVIECSRYVKASFWERAKRKMFWWWG